MKQRNENNNVSHCGRQKMTNPVTDRQSSVRHEDDIGEWDPEGEN